MSAPRLAALVAVLLAGARLCAAAPDHLTSRPLPAAPADTVLKVGGKLSTPAGQPRRLRLPDGALLLVRAGSTLSLPEAGKLELSRGEVFVQSAAGKLAPGLTVRTPKRTVQASDSRFLVRASDAGTAVAVATGSIKVQGLEAPLGAGQLLAEKAERPQRAPRLSHLVAWTRQLRQAAPLVPASEHQGGTLIARDPDGQEAKLELRRYHIDVHVEDGFARTTIDLTYFNQSEERLEGTFRFPLPPDASLSRLAMYVDGKLMEGGMAERERARAAYETIVWEKKDPALMEWVDGSTFKMRVFPLEARQEKRLLLSYSQRLPSLYGQLSYRFPAGHSLGQVRQWSLHVRVKDGKDTAWLCDSHTLTATKDGADLLLAASQKEARLDRDVVLQLHEKTSEPVRFSSHSQDGFNYLLLRYRPDLLAATQPSRRDWVVLVETSGDRDPLLARTQIELVRSLLHGAGGDDTFVVLAAGTRTKALDKAQRNEPAAVDEVLQRLEEQHLVGAFDFGAALRAARPHLEAAKNPLLVHVGSGIPAMGLRQPKELLAHIPKGTRYVGVGVGRRWERSLMQALAEKTGGYFGQVNPDEDVAWRGLDLASLLQQPRLLDASVSDPGGKVTFLPFSRLVSQGEELAAVARFKGQPPARLRVRGLLEGKQFVRELAVKEVRDRAAYLPRSWAKLEIERLLAEDALKHKEAVVELSKQMYVLTPFTSLLVLESEEMYARFKVDKGRKDHWALYPAPAKIPVVFEPLDGSPGDPKKGIKPAPRVVRRTILQRDTMAEAVREPGKVDATRLALLDGRPWRAVFTWLAEQTGKPVVGPFMPTGSFAFINPGKQLSTIPEVIESINEALLSSSQTQKYYLINRERSFTLVPADEKIDETLIPRIAPEEVENRGPTELVSMSLKLKTTVAADLAPEVKKLLGPFGEVVPMETANQLIARDTVASLRRIRKAVHDMDKRVSMGEMNDLRDRAVAAAVNASSLRERNNWLEGQLRLYARPAYTADDRLFYDLLSYAPGLNTTAADVAAVLESEARLTTHNRPGRIAREARALIDRARKATWRRLTLPADGLTPAYHIDFDGAGRYAWERVLPSGLREKVVCDGKTLWHVYPELGLAARRTVSRHHRIAFNARLPFALPSAADLARGADLEALDERSVALVPHGAKEAKKHVRLVLAFAEDGALAERRLVEMPAKKVLRREVYADDGSWKVLDAKGKGLLSVKAKLEEAEAPALKADVSKLVVLDLPYRSPEHTKQALGIEKKAHTELSFAQANALLASLVASGDANAARDVFVNALARNEQRQLGYYVLLACAGANLDSDNLDVLEAHPHEPLAHYLALHSSPVLRKHASRWAAASNVWGKGLLRRLGLAHALLQRWASGKSLGATASQRRGERQRALAYVKEYRGTALAWALLGLMQDRTAEESDAERPRAYAELDEAYRLFEDSPALSGLARYEQARCLWRAGQAEQARKLFLALYRQARKGGQLLRLDGDFRAALLEAKEGGWLALLRQTADELVKDKQRFAVLTLARQCWQVDDQVMARRLLSAALADVPVAGKEGLALYQNALAWLMQTDQREAADALLRKLLADPEHAKRPQLWRQAATLAQQREQPARALDCLEKALALEYADLPEVINLQQVRQDYRSLLNSYAELTKSLATLRLPPPAGFRQRVIRAADRWRALDRDQEEACKLAAAVLRGLGEKELAFDYLVTPVGLRPGEADAWSGLAGQLVRWGERGLADRAYQSAFQRESSNAQILWDRAENLRQAGRLVQARALYRQIASSEWQPRFATLKTQARWMTQLAFP
jgi:hypothetical protein